jgi:Protein of unknown function (DUF3710)
MNDMSHESEASHEAAKSAPDDRARRGPFDESEVDDVKPYIDLGGVKVQPREGLQLRLEVEEASQRVVAVTLEWEGSTLQVQPFAAPRSEGLWQEIRQEIDSQIVRQGGSTTTQDGSFGPELVAKIPAQAGEGSQTTRAARFIGVDGPRWFLRGVISGEAATNEEAASTMDDLFRGIVVVRGKIPMPPRDLIPLKMPAPPPGATKAESAP